MHRDLNEQHLQQEVTVTLPLSVVLRLAEADSPAAAAPTPRLVLTSGEGLPEVGTEWQGGIYAGLSIDEGKVVALVLLAGSIEDVTWNRAVEWAKEREAALPTRIDQLVLFKNLKSEFKEAPYWSGEQYAGNSVYAWGQSFSYGGQYYWRKDGSFRAVAVRRIPLQ